MRTLALLFILLNSASGFGQTAEFFVDHPVHKFPKTREGILLMHTYEIVNKGTEPLVIYSYDVECSCTEITLPEPIQPGESGMLTLTFDTKGKYYRQDRKIVLQTNAKKKTQTLRFKVFVIPKE